MVRLGSAVPAAADAASQITKDALPSWRGGASWQLRSVHLAAERCGGVAPDGVWQWCVVVVVGGAETDGEPGRPRRKSWPSIEAAGSATIPQRPRPMFETPLRPVVGSAGTASASDCAPVCGLVLFSVTVDACPDGWELRAPGLRGAAAPSPSPSPSLSPYPTDGTAHVAWQLMLAAQPVQVCTPGGMVEPIPWMWSSSNDSPNSTCE